ncbi:hypothetical protein AB0425_27555 [Actinosynnema sp. NPDC051121]
MESNEDNVPTPSGDPVCWLSRVCPECGSLDDGPARPVCSRCGAELPRPDDE